MMLRMLWMCWLLWVPNMVFAGAHAHEAEMLEIAAELRCLVCQNESIAASRAELAVDLREQILVLLGQGKTADQVREYMVERYGEFILYRPPMNAATVALWFGPLALLLVGLSVYVVTLRRRQHERDVELSDSERLQAEALLAAQKGEH